MPGVPREFRVTYGAFVVDAAAGYHPTDRFRLTEEPESVSFSFDFIVIGTDGADLQARTDAAIAAWRTPRQKLRIEFAGGVREYDPAANTGFDAQPSIAKIGDDWDSGRSRLLRASVTIGRPADYLGLAGRRSSTVAVDHDESRRRTVTISGEYTALGANSALQQYSAQIAAYTAGVLSALGGTFELVGESTEAGETNKTLRFTRRYREILYAQLGNPAAIVDQQIRISVRREGPGDTTTGAVAAQLAGLGAANQYPVVRRLVTIDVSYTAAVDADVTRDLPAVAALVLPRLSDEVRRVIAASGLALLQSMTTLERDANRFAIAQVYQAALQTGWVEYVRTTRISYETGITTVAVWDGRPFSRYVYHGPRIATVAISERGLFVGQYVTDPRRGPRPDLRLDGIRDWVLLRVEDSSAPLLRGLDGIQLQVTEVDRTLTYEGVTPVAAVPAPVIT